MADDLLSALLDAGAAHGAAPALTDHRGATMSHAALRSAILRTAGSLHRRGFRPGDRMLFSVRPDPAGIVLALGTVAAGGSPVFMDPGVGPELFASRVAVADAAWAAAEALLYTASARGPLRAIARRRGLLLPDYRSLPLRHLYSGRWLPGVPRGAGSIRSLLRGPEAPLPPADEDGSAVTIFTSGTTAAPKAVVHSRGSLGSAAMAMLDRYPLHPGDEVLTDQLMLGLPALIGGAHWTLPPFGTAVRVHPTTFATLLAGATHTFLVPADLAAVLDVWADTGPPTRLRRILLGGAPVLPRLLQRATDLLPGVQIGAVYGMTEILPVATIDAAAKLAYVGPGDPVGTLLPGVEARIDGSGELIVTGPHLCRGYLGPAGEERLTEVATGDLARLDGRDLVLIGRAKDMLIRGDKNIYPGLYEPAIARLPGVAAAVIVGVPDLIGDEEVVLMVVPEAGVDRPEAVARVLRDHPLAVTVDKALPGIIDTWALPDRVVVVSSLPQGGRAGKPDRHALRDLVAE